MKKRSWKPIFFYLLSFFLPAVVILTALAGLRIVPFGDNTLLISDARGLYLSSLAYAGRMFKGLEGVVYSFKKGLGGNMMGYIGGSYLNPVYLLFSLTDINYYPLVFSMACLFNLSLCGTTMYILLRELYGHRGSNLIFSTSYALIGFNVANIFQVMFFPGVQALPLMIVGIRRLFQGRNPWLYIVAIAYTLFANFYQGFVVCVFSVLFFFASLWLEKDRLNGRKGFVFGQYAVSSLCGGLIPVITWLPAILSQQGGRLEQSGVLNFSFAENMPFLEIGSKLFSGTNTTAELQDGLPNIFVGLLPLALVILYFMNRRVDKRRKAAAGALLGFYLLMFYLVAFNMLMHGGVSPNWFNFRYSYIFSFLLLLIAAEEWQYLDSISGEELKRCLTIMVITSILVLSRRYAYVNAGMVLLDYVVLLLMGLGLYMHRRDPVKNPAKTVTQLVLLLTCFSMFGNLMLSTHNLIKDKKWFLNKAVYQDTVTKVAPLVSVVNAVENDFSRMEVTEQITQYTGNDPFLYGYNGVGHSSHERSFVYVTLPKLGVNWDGIGNYYQQGIPAATDALLGIRYLVATEDMTEEKGYLRLTDMKKMGLATGDVNYDLFRSDYALPIAFLSSVEINTVKLPDFDLFDNLNRVWQGISGTDRLAFTEETDISFTAENLLATGSLTAQEGREIIRQYEQQSDSQGDAAAVSGTEANSVSGGDSLELAFIMDKRPMFSSSVKFSFDARQDGPVYVYNRAALTDAGAVKPVVKYMGYYHKGETVTGYLYIAGGYVTKVAFEETVGRFRAAYADLDALQAMSETIRERSTTIEKVNESHLIGTMTAGENQELLFTIPWDESWTCYVDGQKAELNRVLDLFMTVQVSPGEHTYEMIYEPDGLGLGIKVSTAAIICTLLYLIFGSKLLNKLLVKEPVSKTAGDVVTVETAATAKKENDVKNEVDTNGSV